jgi:hypothetical protein
MAWDNTRPVPWNRLIREWLVYAAIMSAIFLVFFRGDSTAGAIGGVLISGPLYLAFGAVMAKFGYQRTRMKDLRGGSKATSTTDSEPDPASHSERSRSKPAPTSRTAGGGNRPKSSSRKRR